VEGDRLVFDLVITNGQILDGSGNPWFRADLGISHGRIQKIGRLQGQLAAEVVDASGLVVSPGFFDMHSMVEGIIFDTQRNPIKVMQGVTTELIGNCGMSLYPVNPKKFDQLVEYWGPNLCGYEVDWKWDGFAGFFAEVEKCHPTTNFSGMVGHGPLRIAVMGYYEARKATADEMAQMKDVLASAMDQGAFGLSTGLVYPPGMYADTQELIELSRVVATKGGFYESHIRSETDDVIEAVQELIDIAEKAGLPGQILHHKTAGRNNFGKSQETVKLIEAARGRGVDITCEVYPYTAANIYIAALLPPCE
jgi:N-acyl-D-amino-acid deacylase